MKFSLITPSHNLRHIHELYDTIKSQTYENWEWILYLNGKAFDKKSDLSEEIQNNKKVVIVQDKKSRGNSNVGFLKKQAFSLGEGSILVEIDHDDLITPDCLEELNKAFHSPEIGFVYSDNAKLKEDPKNPFVPYNKKFGWTYKNFDWDDKKLISMDSFYPDSRSLAFIWYSPDHVRAWRKTVYEEIGGHDEKLSVLDDQDLMVRTYLKTKFFHIKKCLYIYRITGDNTWLERNKAIQTGTVQMFHKYAYQLAERDCELKGLKKIDLGGGINGKSGYEIIDLEGGTITADLDNGIPLEDNSVGVINASHIIEHLKDPIKTMSEIHRVLCDGGWVMIEVPSTDGRGAWQDPTHVSYWNQNSFLYYTNWDQARFIRNNTIKFQEFRRETHFPTPWWKQNNIPVVTCYLNAIKSQDRRPHKVLI